jgi:hypothetical protein
VTEVICKDRNMQQGSKAWFFKFCENYEHLIKMFKLFAMAFVLKKWMSTTFWLVYPSPRHFIMWLNKKMKIKKIRLTLAQIVMSVCATEQSRISGSLSLKHAANAWIPFVSQK